MPQLPLKETQRAFLESLGEPSISIGGFLLWITGPQSSENIKSSEGWLNSTALCLDAQGMATQEGNFIHLEELVAFHEEVLALRRNHSGHAELKATDGNLTISIELSELGSGLVRITLSSDIQSQFHRFNFPVDASYLPSIETSPDRILKNTQDGH